MGRRCAAPRWGLASVSGAGSDRSRETALVGRPLRVCSIMPPSIASPVARVAAACRMFRNSRTLPGKS